MIAYYYCKYDTFCSLLRSKELWLTNLTESNDKQEVKRLYINLWNDVKPEILKCDLDPDIVRATVQSVDSAIVAQLDFDIPYGCCFSYDEDSFSQWREYGDECRGICVGFDLEWFDIKKQYPITSGLLSHSIGYEDVIYDSSKKGLRDSLYEMVYDAIKEHGYQAWFLRILPTLKHYAGFVKNPSFETEHEVRILFYPSGDDYKDSVKGLNVHLESKGKLHYTLKWADDVSNAMRCVRVGCRCEVSANDIVDLLNNSNLNIVDKIPVRKSECSYTERS